LSDWECGELSFEAWVTDLETGVNALGLERFPLLGLSPGAPVASDYPVRHPGVQRAPLRGISQGAPIAIAYTVRRPERVSHLILHGGYARGRLKRSLTPAQRKEAETMTELAELGWGKENPAFRQFFTTQFIPDG